MGSQGAFVAMNNVVSQSVPHLHVHIAPAQPQGRPARLLLAASQVRSEAEAAEVAERIRAALR